MTSANFQHDFQTNESHGINQNGWRSAWAKVAGSSHVQRGVGCDDAIAVDVLEVDGRAWWFCVICDGAGSATNGAEGAYLACNQTKASWSDWVAKRNQSIDQTNQNDLSESASNPTRSVSKEMTLWAEQAQRAIFARAESKNMHPRDFACTWLCVIASNDAINVAQIGDGSVVFQENDLWKVAIWPIQGEYANATNFLSEKDALEKIHEFHHQSAIGTIIGFSDGLQRLALQYNEKKAFQGFLNPLMNSFNSTSIGGEQHWADQFAVWLNSAQVNSRTDDDKTFVIARRSE